MSELGTTIKVFGARRENFGQEDWVADDVFRVPFDGRADDGHVGIGLVPRRFDVHAHVASMGLAGMAH
jgi:hypothetical protein